MLDRISQWDAYLLDTDIGNDKDLSKRDSRTGRPLGNTSFVAELESFTGEKLLPQRPGRKPVVGKKVYCP